MGEVDYPPLPFVLIDNIVYMEDNGRCIVRADTIIPMLKGFINANKLKTGDVVFDRNGKQVKVKSVKKMKSSGYNVQFKYGGNINIAPESTLYVNLLHNNYRNTGYRLKTMYTDEQLQQLVDAYNKSDEDETITTKSAIEEFGSWIVFSRYGFYKIIHDLRVTVNSKPASRYAYNRKQFLKFLIDECNARNEHNTEFDRLKKINENNISIESFERELLTPSEMIQGINDNADKKHPTMYSITSTACVDYNEQDLAVKPYALGAWLGDGYAWDAGRIVGIDDEVRDNIVQDGYALTHTGYDYRSKHRISRWSFGSLRAPLNELLQHDLSSANGKKLSKDIPDEYMIADRKQRRRLLAGLLDTDGTISKSGRIDVNMTDKNVVNKMHTIVRSLGWHATNIAIRHNHYRNSDGERIAGKDSYMFSFYAEAQVFNVRHKKERFEKYMHDCNAGIIGQLVRKQQIYVENVTSDNSIHDYIEIITDSLDENSVMVTSDYISVG